MRKRQSTANRREYINGNVSVSDRSPMATEPEFWTATQESLNSMGGLELGLSLSDRANIALHQARKLLPESGVSLSPVYPDGRLSEYFPEDECEVFRVRLSFREELEVNGRRLSVVQSIDSGKLLRVRLFLAENGFSRY